MKDLYNKDRQLMKEAVDSLNPKIDCVIEVIAFAREAGYKKTGIDNCIAFNKEADQLKDLI